MKLAFIILIPLFLASCATTQPPLAFKSSSGKPEMLFEKSNIKEVRNKVKNECLDKNLEFEARGDRVLHCWGGMQGASSVAAQLLIGNSYSTTPVKKINFYFTQKSSDVLVKASGWVETQMAFGQVRRMELTTNQDKNALYFFLKNVKNYH